MGEGVGQSAEALPKWIPHGLANGEGEGALGFHRGRTRPDELLFDGRVCRCFWLARNYKPRSCWLVGGDKKERFIEFGFVPWSTLCFVDVKLR